MRELVPPVGGASGAHALPHVHKKKTPTDFLHVAPHLSPQIQRQNTTVLPSLAIISSIHFFFGAIETKEIYELKSISIKTVAYDEIEFKRY